MKRLYFLTTLPELIEFHFNHGTFLWAQKAEKVQFEVIDLRDYAVDGRGSVDDRPYGGGEGMVFRPEPIVEAIESIQSDALEILLPSPAGEIWEHEHTIKWASVSSDLAWICPRFGGVDHRVIELLKPQLYSLGNYVVSGGELPALMMTDSILRQIPGVLGDPQSACQDSFSESLQGMIEEPQYTRPPVYRGLEVPAVLKSGDQKAIQKWRQSMRMHKVTPS